MNEFILIFQKQMNEKLRVGMQLISRAPGKEGNDQVNRFRLRETF